MKNLSYLLFGLLLIIVMSSASAQGLEDAIGFNDSVNDVQAAPIHFLIPLALFVGAALAIKKLK